MLYYIWVINMASRYKFIDEEIKAIEQARRENKDKRAEARLKALELRAKGASSKDVAGKMIPTPLASWGTNAFLLTNKIDADASNISSNTMLENILS